MNKEKLKKFVNIKIVLNGLPIAYPISGVGRYTLELGRELEHLLGEGMVFWFGKESFGNGSNDPILEELLGKKRIQSYFRSLLRKIPGVRTWGHLRRSRQFRSFVKNIKPSLYHETNYALFDFEEGPTILTLYDLSFVRHPEWHPKDRVKYFERYCINQLSKIDAIITISDFSKQEIIHLLGIPAEKIFVTPLGVRQDFSPLARRMEELPQDYILFLGNIEPRKNLITLLEAYHALPKKMKESHPLVIAGASGWDTHDLKKAFYLFKMDESIILPGYIPQKYLPNLYKGASVFVYPSFYEGFGLPVIEAMACGVPVIASNTSSFPEIVGDAGILVNPYDSNELKEAIKHVLEDSQMSRNLSERGVNRAKLYTWGKCAKETVSVYETILGVKRG